MSIDTSALDSIRNAISSSTYNKTVKNKFNQSFLNDKVSTIANAASEMAFQSKYKTAFEEKMKIANGASDYVSISKESLQALQKYNANANSDKVSSSEKKQTTYSYDYMTLKKQRMENLAKIEAEVKSKYGKETATTEDTSEVSTSTASTSTTSSTTVESTSSVEQSNSAQGEKVLDNMV